MTNMPACLGCLYSHAVLQRGEVHFRVRDRDLRVQFGQVAVDIAESLKRDACRPALGVSGQDLAQMLHRAGQALETAQMGQLLSGLLTWEAKTQQNKHSTILYRNSPTSTFST